MRTRNTPAPGRIGPLTVHSIPAVLVYLLLALLGGGAVIAGAAELGYDWQWYRIPSFLYRIGENGFVPGPLLEGLVVTLRIVAFSLFYAAAIGTGTALLRISGPVSGQWLARFYVEVIRNTPLLIQIFFIYFVLTPFLGLQRFTAAVLALSLFEGAYISEIIRAGILAVDNGLWEAARSLGFSRLQAYRDIILPIAGRMMLPPLVGQSVSLVKDSALVSTIAIYDLSMRGREIIAETFLVFEVWLTIGLIYLILTVTLSTCAYFLERWLTPRHTV